MALPTLALAVIAVLVAAALAAAAGARAVRPGSRSAATIVRFDLAHPRAAGRRHASAPASGPLQPPAARNPEPEDGPRIGRYRVLQRLSAKDGLTVFSAYDDRLERSVSLTTPAPDAPADVDGRLEREASLLAALNHPCVPAIYELCTHDGRPVMAHEPLDGRRLSQAIAEGISLRESLPAMVQVLDGLACVHRMGLVHRGVTPPNILLGADGRVRLLGFSSTRRSDPAVGDEMRGPGAEDPSWRRGFGPLDARSDLFAVGTILYELVTGQAPFRRSNEMATFYAVLHEPADMRSVPDRPEWQPLRAVIDRALQKLPAARYASAPALRADLERALEALGPSADWFPAPSPEAARPN